MNKSNIPLLLHTENSDVILRELSTDEDDILLSEAVALDPDYSDNFSNTTTHALGTTEKAREKRLNSKNSLRMGIWANSTFVGFIAATPEKNTDRHEIGYFIAKPHAGNGYATTALRAFTKHAVTIYPNLFASVHPEHTASIRVLENCGYILRETRRRDWGEAKIYEPNY